MPALDTSTSSGLSNEAIHAALEAEALTRAVKHRERAGDDLLPLAWYLETARRQVYARFYASRPARAFPPVFGEGLSNARPGSDAEAIDNFANAGALS